MRQDYDNPWKAALEEHFRLFVEFLLGWLAPDINWEHAPESMEHQLRKAHPEAATG